MQQDTQQRGCLLWKMSFKQFAFRQVSPVASHSLNTSHEIVFFFGIQWFNNFGIQRFNECCSWKHGLFWHKILWITDKIFTEKHVKFWVKQLTLMVSAAIGWQRALFAHQWQMSTHASRWIFVSKKCDNVSFLSQYECTWHTAVLIFKVTWRSTIIVGCSSTRCAVCGGSTY